MGGSGTNRSSRDLPPAGLGRAPPLRRASWAGRADRRDGTGRAVAPGAGERTPGEGAPRPAAARRAALAAPRCPLCAADGRGAVVGRGAGGGFRAGRRGGVAVLLRWLGGGYRGLLARPLRSARHGLGSRL